MMGSSLLLVMVLLAGKIQARDVQEDITSDYVWRTGSWGECYTTGGLECGLGFRKRSLWCSSRDGRVALEFLCSAREAPPSKQACYRSCHMPTSVDTTPPTTPTEDTIIKQDCVVGPFSGWSPCPTECQLGNRTRSRAILAEPLGGGRPCPPLTQTALCRPRPECLVTDPDARPVHHSKRLLVGQWGPCQVGGAQDSGLVLRPLIGLQRRSLTCRGQGGVLMDLRTCAHSLPMSVRVCIAPQDCVVGEWSPWAVNGVGCVSDTGQVKLRLRRRRREALQLPLAGGEPCPHLLEEEKDSKDLPPCTHFYKWLTTPWSKCEVSSAEVPSRTEVTCGGGVQQRVLKCADAVTGTPLDSSEMCDELLAPLPRVQRCEVPCPRDCTVGTWGPWGPCRPVSDCPSVPDHSSTSRKRTVAVAQEGYRLRVRHIQVAPSPGGMSCSALQEVQSCTDPACHRWEVGPWSGCRLIETSARLPKSFNVTMASMWPPQCGDGMRIRRVDCISFGGVKVEPHHCDGASSGVRPADSQPCRLPCPFDCVLGGWSAWTPCSRPCNDAHAASASLRRRYRGVVAPAGPGGHPCPDSDQLTEVEPCNTHSCRGFHWMALPWAPCVSAADECGDGSGTRSREVWCVDSDSDRVPDWRCLPAERPQSEEPCNVPCEAPLTPQFQCQEENWTPWLPCPEHCEQAMVSGNKVVSLHRRRRHRRVCGPHSVPSTSEAPLEEEEVEDCPCYRRQVRWSVSEWSECHLAAGERCGRGYRVRALACLEDGHPIAPSECTGLNLTAERTWELCDVDCITGCSVSQWSEWDKCPLVTGACGGHRQRRRQLLGDSEPRSECAGVTLTQTLTCPCRPYMSRPDGDWSPCIIPKGNCGVGRRFRRLACFDSNGHLAEPRMCGAESGLEEEPCMVGCPVDCRVGEWSSWSPCPLIPKSKEELMTRRSRTVLTQSLHGGRPCPELVQKQPCNIGEALEEGMGFVWLPGQWTECHLTSSENRGALCGRGNRMRQIKCVHLTSSHVPATVADDMCDPTMRPEDMTSCEITCPGDCAVSEWSEWSDCSKPCSINVHRRRTRAVLRAPANPNGACPLLLETQACQLNVSCWEANWEVTEWGSCLPFGGSPCGEGLKTRKAVCRRSDGRVVAESGCGNKQKPAPLEAWCSVDCPINCEVSQWTNWNDSRCTCAKLDGEMVRKQFIVTNPSDMGRPCPSQLVQSKPCPLRPCYRWLRNDWGTCDLQGADCGHGVTRREVKCMAQSGDVVDDAFCLQSAEPIPGDEAVLEVILDLKQEEGCYGACEGDCQVTEWGTWGRCHRSHTDGEKGGYQTRSRSVLRLPEIRGLPCPLALWETRPCLIQGSDDYDSVDNEVLLADAPSSCLESGDCHPEPAQCWPPCSVPNSVCTASGACVCVKGLLSRYEKVGSSSTQQITYRLAGCDIIMRSEGDNHSAIGGPGSYDAREGQILAQYYPEEGEVSFWMFAMIGVGCVFVVFVAVTIYLMCHTSPRDPPMRRQTTMTTTTTATIRHLPARESPP